MKYSGVIFDFNGTLFWDTPLHNEAWFSFAKKYNLSFSVEQLFEKIHGRNNNDILRELFNPSLSDKEIIALADEKECIYRELCLKTNMQLAPGVEDFLNFLKEKNIPRTIATASEKVNLDFYFEHLPLHEWFVQDRVVYNNGHIKSKPNPEIYQLALKQIDKDANEVLVFEDAIMGLLAAKNAGAGGIIAVNSNSDNYSEWDGDQIITHFDQVDRNLFKY